MLLLLAVTLVTQKAWGEVPAEVTGIEGIVVEEIMTEGQDSVMVSEALYAVVPVAEPKPQLPVLKFRPMQLVAPLSLIAVGTVGYFSKGFHKLNDKVRDGMGSLRKDHYLHFDDYLQYSTAAAYLGLGFYKKRALDFRERLAVGITAYLAMTAMTNIAKYSFREKRPDGDARNSFPSGHTATVFTGAELIRSEFGWGIGSAAYVVATGVAFMRLYNGRHWLNDVIAGAGFGILSARIGYWMLPCYRKWFKWDRKAQGAVAAAMPEIAPNYLGLNMMVVF